MNDHILEVVYFLGDFKDSKIKRQNNSNSIHLIQSNPNSEVKQGGSEQGGPKEGASTSSTIWHQPEILWALP